MALDYAEKQPSACTDHWLSCINYKATITKNIWRRKTDVLVLLLVMEAFYKMCVYLGTPWVMFMDATPAKWKVFRVICVPGSPILCAERAPTAVPVKWRKWIKFLADIIPLTFRHRASCILGQAFRYSPENAFYIFNQQIHFIIWYLLDHASLI